MPKENQKIENNKPSGLWKPHELYARTQLMRSYQGLLKAKSGFRSDALSAAAQEMGRLIARGWITNEQFIEKLSEACSKNGLMALDGETCVLATIRNGIAHGLQSPHPDLPSDPESNAEWISNVRHLIISALDAPEPLGPNKIANKLGMRPVNVRQMLGKLLRDGTIKKLDYGKYWVCRHSDD